MMTTAGRPRQVLSRQEIRCFPVLTTTSPSNSQWWDVAASRPRRCDVGTGDDDPANYRRRARCEPQPVGHATAGDGHKRVRDFRSRSLGIPQDARPVIAFSQHARQNDGNRSLGLSLFAPWEQAADHLERIRGSWYNLDEQSPRRMTGRELMERGLTITLPGKPGAAPFTYKIDVR